jgi:PAS domain S-box-containing protein
MNTNGKKTILLVEDEALIAMAEAQVLRKHGYGVVIVHNGEKAVEAVDSNPEISLILMDIDLGKGIDGPQTAERILAAHDLPIVFLSSHTEPEVVEKTERIASYGYVVKNSGATVLDVSIKMAFKLFAAKNEVKKHEENLRESEATVRKKLKAITEPEGDIGTLELADIIDQKALQTMMEDFYNLTRIGGAILDVSGKILVGVAWQEICSKFHRVHPDTLKNCVESDLNLTKGVPAGTCKAYHCKNNMWDIVTPIIVDEKHLGNLFIGQFFFEDEVPEYELFRKQARQYGFNETEYLAALDRVPRFSREKVNRAMAFYSRLAEMISSLSYTTIRLSRSMVQHQQAVEDLKAGHNLLNATQRIARIGGWEWDIATDTVTWSEELYRITGLDPDFPPPQFNNDHYKIYTKESWQKLVSVVESTLKTGDPYEIYAQMIRPDGELRDVRIYGGSKHDTNGAVSGLFGIVEDITEKQQREKQLKESEENLRITLNSIGDAVISTDIEGSVVRMNPVAEKLCGWSSDQAQGNALAEVFHIVHSETREKVDNPVSKVLETGSIIGLANHTMLISRDGTEYQIADSASPIRDDTGQILGVVLVFRDVTEEYRVAQALADSERNMARAQTMAQLGSWRLDLTSGIVNGSDQARRIYGVDEGELTLDYLHSVPLPEDRPNLDDALKALIENGEPYDVEFRIRRPSDGTVRHIHSLHGE